MKKVLIFGESGDIGSNVRAFVNGKDDDEYFSLAVNRSDLDFNSIDSSNKLNEILKKETPDIIINCSGVLGTNSDDYQTVFNVNFKSNWDIIRYYCSIQIEKNIKFIMIGSSAYSSGRKDYMLYSASKSALYNLFLSASSFFVDTKFKIGLINLPRVDSEMIKHLPPSKYYIYPSDAGEIIVDFALNLEYNSSIDIGIK